MQHIAKQRVQTHLLWSSLISEQISKKQVWNDQIVDTCVNMRYLLACFSYLQASQYITKNINTLNYVRKSLEA